jgi:fructose-bisphosphate aldolase class I
VCLCIDLSAESCYNIVYFDTTHSPPETPPAESGYQNGVSQWKPEKTLSIVFDELHEQGVALSGIVLKPNMVISGKNSTEQADVNEVAEQTVRCLMATVPSEVPGIAFLSGGQTDEQATQHLNRMNQLDVEVPWRLTFSYGRALQQAPMKAWSGDDSKRGEVHGKTLQRALVNAYASKGEYTADLETASADAG